MIVYILVCAVQLGGEMSELDDAGTYYDLGPRMVTQVGTYYFMCTRNNNFSNRSQKGKITLSKILSQFNGMLPRVMVLRFYDTKFLLSTMELHQLREMQQRQLLLSHVRN